VTNNLNNEKIRIYIFNFGSAQNAGSHAALEFNGQTIDFGPEGFLDKSDDQQHECRVYEIDPKQINVNPQKLIEAINQRKQQVRGSDYLYFSENCAEQVCAVLRQAGAKKLPDETGLGIPTPTMTGMANVISDQIDVPVIGDIVGGTASFVAGAAKVVTGQKTLEEYCQQNGKLAETRVTSSDFSRIQNEFSNYMNMLKDPEAFKQEMRRRCALELQGEPPYESEQKRQEALKRRAQEAQVYSQKLEEYRNVLPPDEFERYQKLYNNYFNKTDPKPNATEQARIRSKYANLIAQASLPASQLEARALNLVAQCGSDHLLIDKLLNIANEKNPQLAAKYMAQVEKILNNLPISNHLRRINVNNRTGNTPPNPRTLNRGRTT